MGQPPAQPRPHSVHGHPAAPALAAHGRLSLQGRGIGGLRGAAAMGKGDCPGLSRLGSCLCACVGVSVGVTALVVCVCAFVRMAFIRYLEALPGADVAGIRHRHLLHLPVSAQQLVQLPQRQVKFACRPARNRLPTRSISKSSSVALLIAGSSRTSGCLSSLLHVFDTKTLFFHQVGNFCLLRSSQNATHCSSHSAWHVLGLQTIQEPSGWASCTRLIGP